MCPTYTVSIVSKEVLRVCNHKWNIKVFCLFLIDAHSSEIICLIWLLEQTTSGGVWMNFNVSIENPGYPQSWDTMIEEPLNNEFWIEKVGSFKWLISITTSSISTSGSKTEMYSIVANYEVKGMILPQLFLEVQGMQVCQIFLDCFLSLPQWVVTIPVRWKI